MDTDKPPMFRRRTDKIYATLQQVQRRITQGTEPGQTQRPPAGETAYTASPSQGGYSPRQSAPPPVPGGGRSISQAQAGYTGGYLVTPDGRRVSAEPDQDSHASTPTVTPSSVPPAPSHPMEQALQRLDHRPQGTAHRTGFAPQGPMLPASPPPPQTAQEPADVAAPPPAYQPPPQHHQPVYDEAPVHDPHAPNPALNLAAREGRPRRIELGIELATVLAIAWLGTIAVAFFIGRGEFTGGGFDEVGGSAAGSQVVGVEDDRQPAAGGSQVASERPSPPPVGIQGNGTKILVLQSVDSDTRQGEDRFQLLADKLNVAARQGNFDPLFGVRRPRSSGGLQLVYGRVDNGFGIRSDDARGKAIHEALSQKFPGLRWVDIGN